MKTDKNNLLKFRFGIHD